LLKNLKIKMQNDFTIQDVRNYWNKSAYKYDPANKDVITIHNQRYTESLKHINLKNGDKVLNIWSRTGNAVPFLKNLANIDLYNLEVSQQMIAIAKKKFPQARFDITDLDTLNFSDNFFDVILCLETLEHTPDPEKLLKEFYRVLKPNHFMVLSLPPKTAELPLKIHDLFFSGHGEGPHKFLASKTVKKLLAHAGFKLTLHKGTLLIPLGPKFLQNLGEKIIQKFQNTFIRELGIRQFYVCKK